MAFIFDRQGEILEVNQVALTKLGFTKDGLSTAGITALLPDYSHTSHDSYLKTFVHSKGKRTMMDRTNLGILNSAGVEIPALISISPMKQNDGYRYLVLARDLSGVKQSEDTKRLDTEITGLRSRHRSMEVLVKNLLDEVNNSLMVLLGHSSIVERLAPGQPKLVAQVAGIVLAVEQIQKATTSLQRVLGVVETERELMSPVEVVTEIVDQFNQDYSTNIVVGALDFNETVKIFTGRRDLFIALTNILTNAFEAAPECHAAIKVNLELVFSNQEYLTSVHCLTPLSEDRHYLEISVSDQGPGLSTERLQLLFHCNQLFEDSAPLEGFGIPASLTSIRALGGTLCIDRRKIDGAKVSVLIPVLGLKGHSKGQEKFS